MSVSQGLLRVPIGMALGLALTPTLAAAPRALDDLALDRVQASGMLVQQPGQSAIGPPDRPLPDRARAGVQGAASMEAGLPPPPGDVSGVVAGGAVFDRESLNQVQLGGAAQSGLTGLNVVNVARADAITGLNVFEGGAVGGPISRVDQTNHFVQEGADGAQLGATTSGQDSRRWEATQLRQGIGDRQSRMDTRVDQELSQVRTRAHYNAAVPGDSLGRDWEVGLDLCGAPTCTLPSLTLPAVSFDWFTGEEPARFGLGAEFSGLQIQGAQVTPASIRGEGDDLVVNLGQISLPPPDLPTVRGELCLGGCVRADLDFNVGNRTTASLDVGEIRLAGANPLQDLDIKLGQGIAAVGSGRFEMQTPQTGVDFNLGLSLPGITESFVLDLEPVAGILTSAALELLPGRPLQSLELDLSLPDARFEISLGDLFDPGGEQGPPWSTEFGMRADLTDGILCLTRSAQSCGTQSIERLESFERVLEKQTHTWEHQWEQDRWSRREQTEQTTGGELVGARADLITLSGSQSRVETYHVVQVHGGAQQTLRALNAANVTTSLMGGATNVARTPAHVRATQGNPLAVSQSNTFVQGFQ
ncbi:hypothetical protein [Ectothiorhodospira variabilis]|uniref:hypothetical protein n=1 Tax=Ectothiorhodospira variabilis TaxID=505694 RepID=UPI001EFC28F4|nr:hypothetical protein [Ectothiorhodospira variabilis]MCG5492945.1 hypothetical protein [Ectothiorhodospira variabilis]MCG5502274.1 hypothetical protein [Ectothiorhodospira variabilis]MCG5505960.1 hypothetical protein [Ectothiorhodospira variabilis]